MKKLVMIAIALITIQVSAQEGKNRHADFSPEEMAQLQTKKMTLALDLTEAQQQQISAINLENAKVRKAKMESRRQKVKGEKPSKEDMLKMKNERLDAQIANKKRMKTILNAEQYEKWEKNFGRRQAMKGKKRMMKHGEHKQDCEYRN